MSIKLTYLKENDDGSATCMLETDKETTRLLIERGLVSLLEEWLDKEEEKKQ